MNKTQQIAYEHDPFINECRKTVLSLMESGKLGVNEFTGATVLAIEAEKQIDLVLKQIIRHTQIHYS